MIPVGDMLLTMTLAPTVTGQNLCGYVLELTVPPSIGRGYIVFDLDPMEVSVNVCNVYRTSWQFFFFYIRFTVIFYLVLIHKKTTNF